MVQSQSYLLLACGHFRLGLIKKSCGCLLGLVAKGWVAHHLLMHALEQHIHRLHAQVDVCLHIAMTQIGADSKARKAAQSGS
eukprot:1160936-Pelagomonas_calceolata.AAC.12